jgi:formyltetrahydrofolate deformylase
MTDQRYILTLSCIDVRGIVAAVSGFITEMDGFIIESAQFGDASTEHFFLRMEFASGANTPELTTLRANFASRIGAKYGMEWQIADKQKKARAVILVSQHGHCLNDLLHRVANDTLAVEVPAVISNHETMRGLVEWYGIPYHYLPIDTKRPAQNAKLKHAQEEEILHLLEAYQADVVVLARYMQILSTEMCERLSGSAINIHHSFLPSFKGARPYEQAYNRGVKIIGATAHYVTEDLDEGPIIDQEVERVDHSYSIDALTAAGKDIECQVLARALKWHCEHRVMLNGRKTVVFR